MQTTTNRTTSDSTMNVHPSPSIAPMRRLRRLPLPLMACVLATMACTSSAGAGFTDPAARVFTIAGGGTSKAADGRPALGSRLEIADIDRLADGQVVFTDNSGSGGSARMWRIDGRGLLRAVPAGKGISRFIVAADGALFGLTDELDLVVLRFDQAAPTTRVIARLADQPDVKGWSFEDVALLPDGTLVVSEQRRMWRVDQNGAVTSLPRHSGGYGAVTGLPVGSVAYLDRTDGSVYVLRPGALNATRLADTPKAADIAALPDGSILVAARNDGIQHVAADGRRVVLAGNAPAYGQGDGGPLAGIRVSAGRVASTPDGGLLIAEGIAHTIRYVAAPGTTIASPLATFSQRTYTDLRAGKAHIISSGAGHMRVEAIRGRRIVATAQGDTAGGELALSFDRPLPTAADFSLQLRFGSVGSGTASARIDVSTRTVLPLKDVHRRLDAIFRDSWHGDEEGATGSKRGRCKRRSATRVDCVELIASIHQDLEHPRRPPRRSTMCGGIQTVRLRPDGVVVAPLSRSGCRL